VIPELNEFHSKRQYSKEEIEKLAGLNGDHIRQNKDLWGSSFFLDERGCVEVDGKYLFNKCFFAC
jgi:hypothetical protein